MRPLLHLVVSNDTSPTSADSATPQFEVVQKSLISTVGSQSLLVCTTDSLDEAGFLEILGQLHASLVLDMRATPRFDFGTLNRRRVFGLFDEKRVSYLDLGASSTSHDVVEKQVTQWSRRSLNQIQQASAALLLIDSRADFREVGIEFASLFRRATGQSWELFLQGPEDESVNGDSRDLVFISHANPEDNDFVLWLHAQLARNGYQTWTDLQNLRGGAVFWDEIEEILRNRAAKVLAITTRAALKKPGVQDEVSLAVSLERARKNPNFVVPLRADDLPYSEFRANLARKNAIDFSQSWAKGLSALLDTLRRDNVPKRLDVAGSELAEWWSARRPPRARLRTQPESLVSNELRVSSVPHHLYSLAGKPTVANAQDGRSRYLPLIPFGDSWLSFWTPSELKAEGIDGLRSSSTFAFEDVAAGNVSIAQHLSHGARRALIVRILNRHFQYFLLSRGFRVMESGGAPTFYVPRGLFPSDQKDFLDTDGQRRKRLLVGHSAKRRVYWHLGCSSRFLWDSDPAMHLRLRVIFSDEQSGDVLPPDKSKDLRRRFCKLWWNDRWRTLELALIASIADSNLIQVFSGKAGTLGLESDPISYVAPIGVDENLTFDADQSLEDVDMSLDTLDDDFDDDTGRDQSELGDVGEEA